LAYFSPPITRYNASDDLYKVVYNETSEIIFTLVAIDRGTPPRGATTTVRMTLSNTCLISVLYEAVDTQILVDVDHGIVRLNIPRYWIYEYGR